MQTFLSDDFLLDTQVARQLYHDHAAKMPIIDYHCHIDPRDIWEDRRFDNLTQVCPSFRPDPALNIHKPGFAAYVEKLEQTVGHPIRTVQDMREALSQRIDWFDRHGCRAADHGLDYVMFRPVSDQTATAALQKVRAGGTVTLEEAEGYQTALLLLNPADNAWLDTLLGAFQGQEVPGKIQHGAAWWFNDHKAGMTEHLTSLANLSLLGNFIGMLTDSRSLLSYARHEYFRRVLCGLLGRWAENGEYPADLTALGGLVEDICYRNAKRYFRL